MLPAAPSAEQMATFDETAKGTEFLPRIQLVGKGKYVDTGKIAPGNWGVPAAGGEEIECLGEKIDVVPLSYRPKGLDVSDKEAIISVYNTKDPEYQRIKAAPKNSGCMWGPSILVLERSTGKLYELFFGNKSGRQEAGKLRPFIDAQAPATLSIRYKQGKDYGWHVPVITKCSEPFDEEAVNVTAEEIVEEIKKFLTPQKTVEKAPDADEDERAR
jgi:hypothetical protein